jgi:demethylmenaquinone methyltransferase/2-methoxy-6-polyprenyl-1,4-benzoquinol methylase
MYTGVPLTYELLNHLFTLGQDILWRKKAARMAAAGGGTHWLDVGIGTGEMAANLQRLATDDTQVIALDFSLPMMREAMKKPVVEKVSFTLGEATRIPFIDNSIDAITLSFASRNINSSGKGNLLKCFREFHRILKPGGVFVNLETSQPRYSIIRQAFHLYVKLTVYPVGKTVSRSKAAYTYLSHSMRRFYSAEELEDIMRQAGFSEVGFDRLMLGAAAIHKARK